MVLLERALTFTDKRELSEYLHNSLLDKELYKVYLANKDNDYIWKHSPIDTFNEVHYQCTRVFNDPNPESEIYYNYLNAVKVTWGTRYASNLIFSMVNALLLIMANPPENVELFMMELQAYLKNDKFYFYQFKDFAEEFIKKYGKLSFSFPYCPLPPEELPQWGCDTWREVTKEFDDYYIRKFVGRYEKVEDKLKLIDIIEEAFNEFERKNNLDELPF